MAPAIVRRCDRHGARSTGQRLARAAIADPRVAVDVTPWWADATDARYLLNRALCLMWLDVRWRAPAVEGEAELIDEVHRLLSKAFPLEPGLPYPWHA